MKWPRSSPVQFLRWASKDNHCQMNEFLVGISESDFHSANSMRKMSDWFM
jgi:hypothetical protein